VVLALRAAGLPEKNADINLSILKRGIIDCVLSIFSFGYFCMNFLCFPAQTRLL
jgi:hypothetical protein